MTTTTTAGGSQLDQLGERVERAAEELRRLRGDRDRLQRERDALALQVQRLEARAAAHDQPDLLHELATLRAGERAWRSERRDLAERIESIVVRLERLDPPARRRGEDM